MGCLGGVFMINLLFPILRARRFQCTTTGGSIPRGPHSTRQGPIICFSFGFGRLLRYALGCVLVMCFWPYRPGCTRPPRPSNPGFSSKSTHFHRGVDDQALIPVKSSRF
ncbi:hypothetical protein EI94DRAFT_398441 [Lactarius quietus]|nr:hypothetical protein EI94DRAFT_398441 [Lactarius quietus]